MTSAAISSPCVSPDAELLALRQEIAGLELQIGITADACEHARSIETGELANRAFRNACERMNELGRRIAGMRATTIEGLVLKAEFSRANDEDPEFAEVAISIVRDLLDGGFRR